MLVIVSLFFGTHPASVAVQRYLKEWFTRKMQRVNAAQPYKLNFLGEV